MPTPGPDPLPRLADALTEVSGRLRDIGDQIRTLQTVAPERRDASPQDASRDARAGAGPTVPPTVAPTQTQSAPNWTPQWAGPPAPGGPFPPPPQWPFPPPPPWAQAPLPPQPFPTQPPPSSWPPRPPRSGLWDRLSRVGAGSRLLAWIGGGVTLAGLVLMLVLAVQRGYVGPLPRVLLGAVLAVVLVGVGLFLHRKDSGRTGALAMAATGLAGLFFDVVAATSIYTYLPIPGGLVLGLVVAAAGTALARHWDSQLFAVFAILGCAVTAPVLTTGFDATLIGFLLVLQIATAPVHLTKRWTGLALAAGTPPVLAVLIEVTITGVARGGPGAATVVALCLVTGIVQIVFAVATALRARDNLIGTGLLLSAPVPTLIGVTLVPRREGALVVGVLGLALLLVWVLQRVRALRLTSSFATAAGGAAVVAAFESACLAFDGGVRSAALLGAGTLLAVLAQRLRYAMALVPATVFAAAGGLLGLADAMRPRYLVRAPIGDLPYGTIASAATTGALAAAAAIALAWATGKLREDADPQAARLRWAAAGGIALYGLGVTVLSIGLAVSPDQRGFLAGHVLVTVSWTVGALVLLLRYVDSTPLRVTGLVLVAAAVAKLVVFDLSSLSGIPRVLVFLVAGLVLLAAGARYASLVADRAKRAGLGSATPVSEPAGR